MGGPNLFNANCYSIHKKEVKPDWERYEQEKAEMGEDFYATSGTAAILPGRLKVRKIKISICAESQSRVTKKVTQFKDIKKWRTFHVIIAIAI